MALVEALVGVVAEEKSKEVDSLTSRPTALSVQLEEELEDLKNTVACIQDVLLQAEQLQMLNKQLKDCVRKAKDAVYDVDDLLDEISTEALLPQIKTGNQTVKKGSNFFSSSNQFVHHLKMGHKIKAIKQQTP